MEFIYFIKLFLDKNPESSIPFFLQYFGSVPSIKAINTCTNFIQLSQQPSMALDILKQINISLPLAPLILQNERQFEGFLFSGINAHQQLSAMLSLLDFLSPPQLSTILRQRDFFKTTFSPLPLANLRLIFKN